MKSYSGFIIFVFVVLAVLFFLSSKEYPQIPADKSHAGIAEISACMECHGPGRQYMLKQSHPPKSECFKCHKTKKSDKLK